MESLIAKLSNGSPVIIEEINALAVPADKTELYDAVTELIRAYNHERATRNRKTVKKAIQNKIKQLCRTQQ